jgi:hypothetical protein
MFSSELTPTALGGAYLAEVGALTHSGCPPAPVPTPTTNPTPPPRHLRPPARTKARATRTHRVTNRLAFAARRLFLTASSRLSGAGKRLLTQHTPELMRSTTVDVNVYATTLSLGRARDATINRFLFTRASHRMALRFASHLAKRKNERVLIRLTRVVADSRAISDPARKPPRGRRANGEPPDRQLKLRSVSP